MHRALCPAALMLSLLLVAAIPAHAEGLRINDVAQTLVNARSGGTAQLRLRAVSQTSNLAVQGGTSAPQDPSSPQTSGGSTQTTDASTQTTISQDPSAPNIETIELGDVTGTVCDCGEIPPVIIPGKGFPLYALFALGAIPLAFLDFGGDEETSFVQPPPPPAPLTPETPIPEPATLLLLGSGLAAMGAGARRRRREQQQAQELCEQTTVVKEA